MSMLNSTKLRARVLSRQSYRRVCSASSSSMAVPVHKQRAPITHGDSLIDRAAVRLLPLGADQDLLAKTQWADDVLTQPKRDLPEFWESTEPKFPDLRRMPEYEVLCLRLSGFDAQKLRHFHSYVHKLLNKLNINVLETFIMPARSWHTTVFKPRSASVASEFELIKHERVFKIQGVASAHLPLLLDTLHTNQPEAVNITVEEFTQELEDARYIPNVELKLLKAQLASYDDVRIRKQMGWIVDAV